MRRARRGPGRLPLLALGLSPLLLALKCEPTVDEAGAAVLLTAPVALGVTALVLWGLSALYGPVVPALAVRWRPVGLGLVGWVLVALVVALPISLRDDVWTWVPMALGTYGACVLAWSTIFWRVWVHRRPSDAFVGAPLYVHLILTLPALPMTHAGALPSFGDHVWGVFVLAWVFTGFLGIPAGVLLLLLLAEGAWRRRRVGR